MRKAMTEQGEKPMRREVYSLCFGIGLAMWALLGVGCATSEDGTRQVAHTTAPADKRTVFFNNRVSDYQPPSEKMVRVVLWLVEDIQGVPEYEKDLTLLGQDPLGEPVRSDLPRSEIVSRVMVKKLLSLGLPTVHRPRVLSGGPADSPSNRLGATVQIRTFNISLSPEYEARVVLECAFFEPDSTVPFWSGPGEGRSRSWLALEGMSLQEAIELAVNGCVEQSHVQDVSARVQITASKLTLKKGHENEASGNMQGALDLYVRAYRDADDAQQSTEAVKALALLIRKKSIQPPFPEEARKFGVQANSLAKAQQYDKAIELYEKALDVAPWWAEGHFNRALILADQNQFPSAISSMNSYLILAPTAPDARAAQDKIYEWELKVK